MSEVEEILDNLQYGVDFEFVDEKIDDGCDEDDEDEYVMMRSYNFYLVTGKQYYVRFYYGNNTLKIGTYDTKDETRSPNGCAFYGMTKRKLKELGGYHAFKDDERFFVKINRPSDSDVIVEVAALYLCDNPESSIRLIDVGFDSWDVNDCLSNNDVRRIANELNSVKS